MPTPGFTRMPIARPGERLPSSAIALSVSQFTCTPGSAARSAASSGIIPCAVYEIRSGAKPHASASRSSSGEHASMPKSGERRSSDSNGRKRFAFIA